MSEATAPPLLDLLQELLDLPALEPTQALNAAATAVARWLACEKTDVFLFDAARSCLVAAGTSETPLGELQRSLGLDVLPIAQGGRVVQVYLTGAPHVDGHVEQDSEELRGIIRELGVRSHVGVPIEIAGVRRGVLSAVSQQPERFTETHAQVVGLVGRWMGALAHRAELVNQLRAEERERGRRMAADEIITVLAHDIWNHLNPLSATLQLLRLKLSSAVPIEPKHLDTAVVGAQRLARLTQDLLDAARLEQGLFELELAPVDLSNLVRDVGRVCARPGTEVLVEAPESLTAIIDSNRLRQALENVIFNGVRHSPRGAPLRVRLEPSDHDRVMIRITDAGPGIKPHLLPHLFERFVAEGPTRGLGLGLYLAHRIASAHGGTLEAKSNLGSGAEFTFVLPLEGVASRQQDR
jgi:signal transduction histidine kinase